MLLAYTGLVSSGLVWFGSEVGARSLAASPACRVRLRSSCCSCAYLAARGSFSTTCGTQNWPRRHRPTTLCVSPARRRMTSPLAIRQPARSANPALVLVPPPPPPPAKGCPNRPTQLAQKQSTGHAASPTITPSSLPANHRSLHPTAPLHQTLPAPLYLYTHKQKKQPLLALALILLFVRHDSPADECGISCDATQRESPGQTRLGPLQPPPPLSPSNLQPQLLIRQGWSAHARLGACVSYFYPPTYVRTALDTPALHSSLHPHTTSNHLLRL